MEDLKLTPKTRKGRNTLALVRNQCPEWSGLWRMKSRGYNLMTGRVLVAPLLPDGSTLDDRTRWVAEHGDIDFDVEGCPQEPA